MLTKKTSSSQVFLEVKHHCIWRQIKTQAEDCDAVEVTNPKTKEVLTKYGYRYDSVAGYAVKLQKYDTGTKYGARYFGFKLHLADEHEVYVLDLPYHSQVLRRLLRAAPNIDWAAPLTVSAFKARKKDSADYETGIWLRQGGDTIKAFYTKDEPHGMPAAEFDKDENRWDFRAQHRWLVAQFESLVTAQVAATGERHGAVQPAASMPPVAQEEEQPQQEPPQPPVDWSQITDDDVPF